jgi:hypothetical protein
MTSNLAPFNSSNHLLLSLLSSSPRYIFPLLHCRYLSSRRCLPTRLLVMCFIDCWSCCDIAHLRSFHSLLKVLTNRTQFAPIKIDHLLSHEPGFQTWPHLCLLMSMTVERNQQPPSDKAYSHTYWKIICTTITQVII